MSVPFVRVRDVTKRYGTHTALMALSLDVGLAESVVVLGPSGCGKTTLLRLLAGLEVPHQGEIWLAGRQVAEPGRNLVPPHERRIGFVFQDLALWPHLTVREHLTFVMGSVRVPKSQRPQQTRETLGLVRIERLAHRYPHELSGGEQQRVALARALVGRPRLLLLDEPFSSLDPDLRATLRSELSRLRRALELTMIYVTHDREDAAVLADRIVMMREGQIQSIAQDSRPR
ncbi:MAG: ATP-binding cassette domain-containing protein [Luteitalea sp.]|nr:ATP-binding cassette domain-containing protein [Luteitalea sp.]